MEASTVRRQVSVFWNFSKEPISCYSEAINQIEENEIAAGIFVLPKFMIKGHKTLANTEATI